MPPVSRQAACFRIVSGARRERRFPDPGLAGKKNNRPPARDRSIERLGQRVSFAGAAYKNLSHI